MSIFINILLLIILFIILNFSANLVVKNIKYIGAVLEVRLFAFGILLGLITTLPELSLGINATIDKINNISLGNLLGGIIVLLGLVLGSSLLFGQKIVAGGQLKSLIPIAIVIILPTFLGFDGIFNFIDGLIMISLYIGLIFYLYKINHFSNSKHLEITDRNKISKSFIYSIIGIILILISSHYILENTINILNYFSMSQFLIGLIVFSIGTNLPEISIALTSFTKKSSELSLSVLLSSAFTNILVLGIIALLNKITFEANVSYYITVFFIIFTLIMFVYFDHKGKEFTKKEGLFLVILYLLFILSNIFINF